MTQSPDSNADGFCQIAREHHRAGRLPEAENAYRQALEHDLRHAGALYGLGTLALQVDQHAMAEQLIAAAIAVRGEWAQGCYHLGVTRQGQSHYDQAIASFRRAAALAPEFYEAHYQLAICLQISGELQRSLVAYAQAFSIRSDDAVALTNYGIALTGARQWSDAIAVLTRAAGINPKLHETWLQLGCALRAAGKLGDAIDAFHRAGSLLPNDFKTIEALAGAQADAGKFDDATAALGRALALVSEDADAHCALGELLLRRGEFAGGLAHLEHRWRLKKPPWPRRRLSIPRWDGGDLRGRAIYLHAEQSIGDAIQFVRWIPMLSQTGAAVVAECQPALRRLFAANFPHVRWISPGEPLPPCDVYCPMLNVPRALGIDPPWRGADCPYLQLLGAAAQLDRATFNVGLVWAGSPSNIANRARSLPIEQLAPLGAIAGASFFSLQKGWPAAEAKRAPFAMVDLTGNLDDFSDTAAMIASLDLVISVDTAVAHLAGAMGKPVWTLLPSVSHWRWMESGDTTPWYPSMRLFRQPARGDWENVVARATAELAALVAHRAGA